MDIPENRPVVSCLCLTRGRADKLPRSIACFSCQTYPRRELVIVCPEEDEATRAVLALHRDDPRIRCHLLPSGSSLTFGETRNLSVEIARGEFFCVWDDDDWYHPERIDSQVRAVTKYHKAASMLTNLVILDTATGDAYLSQTRLWEGSLICRRSTLSDDRRYEAVNLVEDSRFVNSLIQDGLVYPLIAPNLYVYELHDRNNSGGKLREIMLEMALKLSPQNSAMICEVLSPGCSPVEAAKYMNSPELLEEFDYFHGRRPTMVSEKLARFREFLNS
jgi:glycosyltransferase involved in cell wall biosynthesis